MFGGPRLPRRHPRRLGKRPSTTGDGLLTPPPLIRPSLAEIRRLLARTLLAAARCIDHVLQWSLFRRLHQIRALIRSATTAAAATPYQRNCECSAGRHAGVAGP
jgi:hypothetical protein